MAKRERRGATVKKAGEQLELSLPELNRPRWRVRGYFPEGEKLSGPFDDKKDAENFKNELVYVCLASNVRAFFQVEQEKEGTV